MVKSMLRLLLSTALVAATILPSFAADPVPTDQNVVPVDSGRLDWSGVYVGGVGSYAYGKNAFSERGVGASSLLGDINDYIGGITLGVNHQDGNFVVGLEGDYSFGTIDFTSAFNSQWVQLRNARRLQS